MMSHTLSVESLTLTLEGHDMNCDWNQNPGNLCRLFHFNISPNGIVLRNIVGFLFPNFCHIYTFLGFRLLRLIDVHVNRFH